MKKKKKKKVVSISKITFWMVVCLAAPFLYASYCLYANGETFFSGMLAIFTLMCAYQIYDGVKKIEAKNNKKEK